MKRATPSRTAEAVCLFRALDQLNPSEGRTLDDPYAKLFLGPIGRAALATVRATGRMTGPLRQAAPGLANFVVARHRFIDQHLLAALESGEAAQLVLLGAGYDTRAYRFAEALGGRRVFEVDFPATSRRKAHIVERHTETLPEANLTRVEIDFQTQSLRARLLDSGFETGAPTFFVWEGVSMYLSRAAIKETLATVRALGSAGSGLSMDFWYLLDTPDLRSTAYRVTPGLLHLLGEPITFGIHPEDVGDFMRRESFEVVDLAVAEELERRYPLLGSVYPADYILHARTMP